MTPDRLERKWTTSNHLKGREGCVIQYRADTPASYHIVAKCQDAETAQLLSAAPELLEACRAFVGAFDLWSHGAIDVTLAECVTDEMVNGARAAIAKAEGREAQP